MQNTGPCSSQRPRPKMMVQKSGFYVSVSIGPHTCIFSQIHVCIFYSERQTAKSGNVDPSYDYDLKGAGYN